MKMSRGEDFSLFFLIYRLKSAFVNSGTNLLNAMDFDNSVPFLMVSNFSKKCKTGILGFWYFGWPHHHIFIIQ